MMAPCITTENLGKRFGKLWAARGVSFEVRPGEIVGFIGQNGAGKTTVMRMIMSLLRPTAGRVVIQGGRTQTQGAHRVGFMPQNARFSENASVEELIRFYCRLRGCPNSNSLALAGELGLDLSRSVRVLSPGQQKKLQLVVTLTGEPEILVLDEPTAGLDPLGVAQFRNLVRKLRDQGRSILISTHVLLELDQICDRVIIVDSGELLYQGVVPREFEVETDGFSDSLFEKLLARWGSVVELNGTRIRLGIARATLPSVLRELLQAGVNVYSIREDTLERFFSAVIEKRKPLTACAKPKRVQTLAEAPR